MEPIQRRSATAGRSAPLYTFAGFTRFNGEVRLRYSGPVNESKEPTPEWVQDQIDSRTSVFANTFKHDDRDFYIVLFPLPQPTPANEIAKMLSDMTSVSRLDPVAYNFLRTNSSPEEIRSACSRK